MSTNDSSTDDLEADRMEKGADETNAPAHKPPENPTPVNFLAATKTPKETLKAVYNAGTSLKNRGHRE